MPSLSAATIYLFGATSLVAGIANLLDPAAGLSALQLPPHEAATTATMRAMSVAAVAMGLYYPLAAWQENRAFFAATVPMRLLTAGVFFLANGGAWRLPAAWEGGGALLTAAALLWEGGRGGGGGGGSGEKAAGKAA